MFRLLWPPSPRITIVFSLLRRGGGALARETEAEGVGKELTDNNRKLSILRTLSSQAKDPLQRQHVNLSTYPALQGRGRGRRDAAKTNKSRGANTTNRNQPRPKESAYLPCRVRVPCLYSTPSRTAHRTLPPQRGTGVLTILPLTGKSIA